MGVLAKGVSVAIVSSRVGLVWLVISGIRLKIGIGE